MVFIDLNKVGKEYERVTAKLNDHEVAELIQRVGVNNMGCLETIKEIYGFDVTFIRMKTGFNEWFCAYVRLPETEGLEDKEYLSTYKKGEVWGVDTAHCYNKDQTMEEKFKDAEKQIKKIIEWFKGDML